MARDDERVARIRLELEHRHLDALVCTLTSNVRLLSGYWPVVGTSIAIATREGVTAVLAPEDEQRFVAEGWADPVRTFTGGSLDAIRSLLDLVQRPFADLIGSLGLRTAVIGTEGAGTLDPSSYAATFNYGSAVNDLLHSSSPEIVIRDAADCLATLRSTLTPEEIAVVRHACGLAGNAYATAAASIRPGLSEREIAAMLSSHLGHPAHERCGGFAYCMSGPNASYAHAAFQNSTPRVILDGDCILLHCNSYCAGMWTDITRTFWMRARTAEQRAMQDAVLSARQAAFAAVRPGVRASAVDRAARDVMEKAGYGRLFRHSTGHGVGFAAIDHNARPRIHPRSDDVLEAGMVFNIEPAAYVDDTSGIRHCDMALVSDDGAECLTPFQSSIDDLVLSDL